MTAPKRNRARVLTTNGLKKLCDRIREWEREENGGIKCTQERLGELTGLDPETVKNVLERRGSDKKTIARCFASFDLTLEESDYIPASQAKATTTDPNFVGRDEAIADLQRLVDQKVKVIVIQARGGVGKTTLARKYLQQEFGSFLEFPIAKETKDIASIEGLIEEKLRQLGEEPGREFWVSLDRLKRKLQAEPIGILIDNLEPALDSAGKFIEAHRRYVELIRVLSDPTVQSVTLITSRERLREADVKVESYVLKKLDLDAWKQFFENHNIIVPPFLSDDQEEKSTFAALHHAYGGNAKAMDIIRSAVLEDFSGNIEDYWQANQEDLLIERDLEDLVTKQFNRLQNLDLDAYNLLCRMGCYRYQDVPTVPIEGLFCLLWDVPENRHRRVIKSLQDRSLVDFESEKFWLHPVIRAEAIKRLKDSEDWNKSNRIAAEFWTSNIATVESLKDALTAFEAYYHYIEVGDFEEASDVVIRPRDNIWQESEHLGRSFYRLGLFKQIVLAINLIIINLIPGYKLAQILNILGDIYWLTGNIHKAIECHKKSREVSVEFLELASESNIAEELQFKLKNLEIVAFFNTGLCLLDLWRIEEAIDFFKITVSMSEKIGYYRCLVPSFFCLALAYSCLDTDEMRKEAISFAERCYSEPNVIRIYAKRGTWAIGYRLLFLGLAYKNVGEEKKSFEMYSQAISFSEASYYPQVKAFALTGLAELYRYKQNFDKAFSHHLESIKLLDEIGAKCDLAEAYYQLGLTLQVVGRLDESNKNFQKAIRLFNEIEAPKQVERVINSMQNSV